MLFSLRNLENVLQRNLRTGTARECIFRASGGTRFKNFDNHGSGKGGGTPRCNWLPKKTLDMSLTYSKHCQTFKMEHFAKIIMPECWYATRNFSGQEELGPVELGHFDKCLVKNTMRPFLSKIRKLFSLVACLWV